MPILALLLGAAVSASAHEFYPVRPVRATLRVEPDRVVADLRADSIIWILEIVGLNPMPTSSWPPEARAKVEAYVNAHLRLAAGGRPLTGRLVEGRYRQLPWEVNEEGVFLLRLVYPPAPPGSTLSGTADFYADYRKEIEAELGGRPVPDAEGYRTLLTIPGRRRFEFTLTAQAPSFEAPSEEARRSVAGMALESLLRGAGAALGSAAGFPVLIAIALCLGAKPPRRAASALGASAAAAGFIGGIFLTVPAWLPWAAALGSALAAGRGRAAAAAVTAAACGLGLTWHAAAGPLLPHFRLALPFALTGALAAGAALLLAAWLAVRSEYRRLEELSESRVEELFARRTALAATALMMVSAYGLWQSLQG